MKVSYAIGNLAALQCQQPLQTEFFHCKAPEYGAIDHRAPKSIAIDAARSGQITHEAAGKAVSGSSRIVDLFERERGHAENPLVMNHHGAVLPALDDQGPRAEFEDVLCSA